jgi:hypothetical protein
MFVDELLEAYPNAKVIVTNRDVDSWARSMEDTFFTITKWKTMPLLKRWDTVFWGPYQDILSTIMSQWGNGNPDSRDDLKKYYLKHYEDIRSKVPKDRLLELQLGNGWEPLCGFLGKKVPEGEYPRVNDAKHTVKLHAFLYYYRIAKMTTGPLLIAVSVAVGVAAIWWALLEKD